VRFFPPHLSYQPIPEVHGERVLGCPDFRTQEEAAYFLAVFSRTLSLPTPPVAVELETEQRLAVDRRSSPCFGLANGVRFRLR
jgi:hypothetical protein